MPSYRRLQQYAIAMSIISVIYNGLEGGLSIGFGAESKSRSLIFYGIQSAIEVISAILVVWRFRKVARPGEEKSTKLSESDLKFERRATLGIGALLIALALSTIASSIAILVLHEEPDTSNASLIISASALLIMFFIWLPKRYLASALDSSAMRGEAICSLSCIQLTFVLFIGSLIYKVWHGGWWLDGATSMVLSFLFGWEGFKMIRWALSEDFTGGCCDECRVKEPKAQKAEKDPEQGIKEEERCGCCATSEKGSCGGTEDGALESDTKIAGSVEVKQCNAKSPATGAVLSQGTEKPDDHAQQRPGSIEDDKDSCCSDCT